MPRVEDTITRCLKRRGPAQGYSLSQNDVIGFSLSLMPLSRMFYYDPYHRYISMNEVPGSHCTWRSKYCPVRRGHLPDLWPSGGIYKYLSAVSLIGQSTIEAGQGLCIRCNTAVMIYSNLLFPGFVYVYHTLPYITLQYEARKRERTCSE